MPSEDAISAAPVAALDLVPQDIDPDPDPDPDPEPDPEPDPPRERRMSTVVARVAGIVAYSDNSHAQFAAHLDQHGNVSVNSVAGSKQATLEAASESWLSDMFTLLEENIPTLTNAGVAGKTVTSMTAELSGRVAFDDNTHGDFIVQYTPKTGAYVPSGGLPANWSEAVGIAEGDLTAMFEAIADSVSYS